MKKIYINSIGLALGALLFSISPANAQRGQRPAGGGGGGNSAPAAAPAAPSVAPRVEVAPPQQRGGNVNMAPQRQNNAAPEHLNPVNNGGSQRGGYNGGAQRGNYNNGNSPATQSNNGGPQRGNYNNGNTAASPNNNGGSQRDNYNNGNAGGSQNHSWPQRGNNGNTPQRANNYNGSQPRGNANGGVNIARPRAPYNGGQRGNYNPRIVGNYSNGVYRSYPGLAYGHNRITVRPQGLYYRNRGYYGSYYAPRLGFSLNVLPLGYYPFYYGPSLYFYSDGLYYQRSNDNYTVVEPPIGAEIKSLPDDAQSIMINGVQYYESNGIYYQSVTKDDGTITYQIAGKDGELNTDDATMQDAPPPLQIGDLVDSLPENYQKIKLNGQKYYVTEEGYYLQDAVDADGNKVYKIVGTPDDEPANDK